MNTLHGISTSAVVTRLHDVHRSSEKAGADGGPSRASGLERGRGCARGTGRQHTTFMTVVDAPTG
ncbi:SigE family RNA polymerase sigma factor, partial [Streptomyces cahuitamycinicus]